MKSPGNPSTSNRAFWHDYNGGIFFATGVTKNRIPYFGYIKDGEMHLSEIGKILTSVIEEMPKHLKFAHIVEYVVMPNHYHILFTIDYDINTESEYSDIDLSTYEGQIKWLKKVGAIKPPKVADKFDKFTERVHHNSKFARVVGNIASYTSKEAHKINPNFAWQKPVWDIIVRSEYDWYYIREYIINNVANWERDRYSKL